MPFHIQNERRETNKRKGAQMPLVADWWPITAQALPQAIIWKRNSNIPTEKLCSCSFAEKFSSCHWNESIKVHSKASSHSHVQALPVLHTYYVFNSALGNYISHYLPLLLLNCISFWLISSTRYQYSFSTIVLKSHPPLGQNWYEFGTGRENLRAEFTLQEHIPHIWTSQNYTITSLYILQNLFHSQYSCAWRGLNPNISQSHIGKRQYYRLKGICPHVWVFMF